MHYIYRLLCNKIAVTSFMSNLDLDCVCSAAVGEVVREGETNGLMSSILCIPEIIKSSVLVEDSWSLPGILL